MDIKRHTLSIGRKEMRNGQTILFPHPAIDIGKGTKDVLNTLRTHRIKYKRIHQCQSSVYYLLLIPKGDYMVQLRISNHTKPKKDVLQDPFIRLGKLLLQIDIHCFEALEYFMNNFYQFTNQPPVEITAPHVEIKTKKYNGKNFERYHRVERGKRKNERMDFDE